MIFVTGGAGFIGSSFVLDWLATSSEPVVNIDKLTYAGCRANLAGLAGNDRHLFVQADICDAPAMAALLARYRPRAVVHLAAETHVDRSIAGPAEFVRANITGTFTLLEAVLAHWRTLPGTERDAFRFVHGSTDEVYGALGPTDPPFTEDAPCRPNSPYSASKAASDHLVRAWHQTYGLPGIITRSANSFGPRQHPEKLIPLTILNALAGLELPIYGDGRQVRDWIHVGDHCVALRLVLARGQAGAVYNIGARNERRNIDLVQAICAVLDEMQPRAHGSYADQIRQVADRPGHDRRYGIDPARIESELGWRARQDFTRALGDTIAWFLANPAHRSTPSGQQPAGLAEGQA